MSVECLNVFGKGCCGSWIKGIRLAPGFGADSDNGSPFPDDLEERSRGSLSFSSPVDGIDKVVREREGVDGNLTLEEDDKLIEFGIGGIGCCWYFGFGLREIKCIFFNFHIFQT